MWEGPSRPQQHSRALDLKKNRSVSPSTFTVACWMETALSHNTHQGRNSLTQLFLAIWKAKSMFSSLFSVCCNPLPHCDCYLTCCPLWDPGGRERELCVYERREMMRLSYVLTCLYSSERNQQHSVCKTTLEIGNIFCVVQGKEQICLRDRI